jgi:hypothetical protein
MIMILSTVISILAFRFRRRASLELELIGLRHQVGPQRPGVGKAGDRGPVASQKRSTLWRALSRAA